MRVADGGTALVVCVARLKHKDDLVVLPCGLVITLKHPVFIDSRWQRPEALSVARVPSAAGMVFNVVLDRCHVLLVEGVVCVTWGHELIGEVVEHPFFGTGRITRELAGLPGWADGRVDIAGCLRDRAAADKVVGMIAGQF